VITVYQTTFALYINGYEPFVNRLNEAHKKTGEVLLSLDDHPSYTLMCESASFNPPLYKQSLVHCYFCLDEQYK
jgi:hypothetical protein